MKKKYEKVDAALRRYAEAKKDYDDIIRIAMCSWQKTNSAWNAYIDEATKIDAKYAIRLPHNPPLIFVSN